MSNGPKMVPFKFRDDFGNQYQIKILGIYNNFNQFTHLSSASGSSNNVIKMAAITQL